MKKQSLITMIVTGLVFAGISVSFVDAQVLYGPWVEAPIYSPSNGSYRPAIDDAPAMIRVSSASQAKTGNLQLGANTNAPAGVALSVPGSASIDTVAFNSFIYSTTNPQPGRVLMIADDFGTVGLGRLPDTGSGGTTPVAQVYNMEISFVRMMQDAQFRTWYGAQPNGLATMPLTTQTAIHGNDRGFGGTTATANKLCEYFADDAVSLGYEIRGLGSGNNNQWWFWNTRSEQWEINSSPWNDSTDIFRLTCYMPSGIVRGQNYEQSATNVPYSGNSGQSVCAEFSTATNNVISCVPAVPPSTRTGGMTEWTSLRWGGRNTRRP